MLGHHFQTIQNRFRSCLLAHPCGIGHLWMSLGQCTRFIQHHRIDLSGHLQAFGIFNQDSMLRSLADTDHDGGRRGQSQGTRTSDDKHRYQSQHTMGKSIFRSQDHPCHKGNQRYRHDGRYKDGSNLIDQLLHRCLATLGILHHTDNLRQQGILSYLVRHETEGSFLIDGTGINLGTLLFPNGKRLSTEHTLVHIRLSLAHHSIYSNPFSRLHENRISRTDRRHRPDTFPLGCPYRHGLGLQAHQFADGRRSVPLGTLLQQPSQQDKGYDNTRSLEIDMRFYPTFQPERWKEQIEQTERVCNARAQSYQGIHIASTMLQLFPGTAEETSSKDKHHRRSKQPHHIVHPPHIHPHHTEHHDRHRQHNRPYSAFLQTSVTDGIRLFRLIRNLFLRSYQQVITCMLYHSLQDLRRAHIGIISDHRRSRSIIDKCFLHTGLTVQGLIHPSRTGSTTHPQYRERFFSYH